MGRHYPHDLYEEIPILEAARRCGLVLNDRTLEWDEVEASCPFCGDRGPGKYHLSLNTRKNQYRCNLCEASGNSVSLYARMNGTSYRQAHEVLSKDGGIYRFPQQPLSQKPPEPEPKPLAMRHDVYYDMLSHLTLSPKHHNDLLSRGLSEERISQNMYRSLPSGTSARRLLAGMLSDFHDLEGIPGFYVDTNEYKKLANISLDRGSGVFSYDNLEADPNVDALSCCQDAQELFALYQTCASRRQIDTLLQNYLDTMQAVKAARGRIYFIPRDYMPKLALFEDFIALLEQHNQHKYADRLPLDANSMFVVDDEKQRSKMALAFYRTIQKDLAEYEKRATHLIQSGNQSPAIMDRMVLSIRELERKKIYYESILKQELHEVDEQYTSLRYLSDELQIRARSIQAQKRLAA